MIPRSFKITNRAALMRIASALPKILVSEERPVMIEVYDYKAPKTRQQEKYFHALLTDAAEQVTVEGRKFTLDAWKEYFARKYLGTVEVVLPSGEIVVRRKSTAEASIAEYNEMIERTLDELAHDYGFLVEQAA